MKYSTILLAALASSVSAQLLSFSSGSEAPPGLPTGSKPSGSLSGDAFPTSDGGFSGESGIGSFPTGHPSGGSPTMSVKAAFWNQFAVGTGPVGGTGYRHTGSARRTKSKHASKSASATLAARQDSSTAAIPTGSAPPGKPSGSGGFSHPSGEVSRRASGAAHGSGGVGGSKAFGAGNGGIKPTGFEKPSGSTFSSGSSSFGAAGAKGNANFGQGFAAPSGSASLSQPTGGFASPSGGAGFGGARPSGGQGQGQGGFSYAEGSTKSGDYGIPTGAPTTFSTSIKQTTTA